MKPKKVLTPGSYGKKKEKTGTLHKTSKKKIGRPSKKVKRAKIRHRESYTEQDILEAIRLVKTEEFSVRRAAMHTNDVKLNEVPRMTLANRLSREEPVQQPDMGRPTELSAGIEEGLVVCLEKCAEFQYPMTKRQLQDLVQEYCIENNVRTKWEDDRPGIGWVRKFKQRWSHRVKVRRPTNIKRSRAKISPDTVRAFHAQIAPNLEGVPSKNIFNYDETGFKDDPGSEDAFFGGSCKIYEKIRNHSKTTVSVMFCCSADGTMLPPMTVYKSATGSVYSSWCEGGPDHAVFAATRSGWFDMDMFNRWFKQVGVISSS
jgi:hypothetical protein